MTYATLTFGRVRYQAIETLQDGRTIYLSQGDARDKYERDVVQPVTERNTSALERHDADLKKFDKSVAVTKNVEVRRDTGGLRKSKVLIDEVIIGGTRHEVEAGGASRFVTAEREKRHPAPPQEAIPSYESWFKSMSAERRTWQAELATSSGSKTMALPEPLDWSWGFPIAASINLLEDLERDGWKLVYVSEDRGLYAGTDASYESYPTRVRYLLHQ